MLCYIIWIIISLIDDTSGSAELSPFISLALLWTSGRHTPQARGEEKDVGGRDRFSHSTDR